LFSPDITLDEGVETTHSYTIFLWALNEDTGVMETLTNQLETLKEAESASWNPQGTILAVRNIYELINGKNYTDGLRKNTLDQYAEFPHERGRCVYVTDVPVLDQWRLRNGTYIHNGNLFPLKTPENFQPAEIELLILENHIITS
jgi:hypothetical protein